jgi:shikimate dehydrogenase
MQDAAFSALGLDCKYLPSELNGDALPEAIAGIAGDVRILGANVTIPHKEAVLPLLDHLDPLAERIGAVNTISRHGKGLKGWNTDVEGFRRALRECGYTVEGKAVAILGAGGAARAVAAALAESVAQLFIVARNREQAVRLQADLRLAQAHALDMRDSTDAVALADVVVNATPADLPIASSLQARQQWFDLRSRRSPEGRAMLLHQGAASFTIWTRRAAPIEAMRLALERAVDAVPA